MEYKLGEQYEMVVRDIRQNSAGDPYILVTDNEGREFRIYNILKCQLEELPNTLYVKVRSVDAFGRFSICQDEGRVFQEHYQPGKMYPFHIFDIKHDRISDKDYYLIEDDFATHRYYIHGKRKYEVGDDAILEVDGFTDKGFLKLKEVSHKMPITQEEDTATCMLKEPVVSTSPILDLSDECETLELKTSIVFPPGGNHEPDIDKQLSNIIKVLIAFMNTKGGKLYIGIQDKTKAVVGIDEDFAHLNGGEEEDYDNYSADNDGYELKIRNRIDKYCTGVAGSLISFNFQEKDGRHYCVISVKAARRPVWFKGNQLWVRQGNRNKQLYGDEISFYVSSRMSLSIKDVIDTEDLSIPTFDQEKFLDSIKNLLRQPFSIPDNIPVAKLKGETDYWITWFDNSNWKRTRNRLDDKNITFEIEVPKGSDGKVLAFCYSSGTVNTIELKKFRNKVNLKELKKNGWSRNEKPMAIFLMDKNEFLVGYSIDSHGKEFVKIHLITDFNPTQSAANQGGRFVPQDLNVRLFAPIGPEHSLQIGDFVVPGQRKTVDAGIPLDSVTHQDKLFQLASIFKQN